MSDLILTQKHDGQIATVQLNRPDVLNALNLDLMVRLVEVLHDLDKDDEVRCIVIHGNERAFAAGADITEMAEASSMDMLERDQFARWDSIRRTKTPLIAAVSGFALGGGCELTMICDMIVASETARFGQPEINIGIMPGAGGTQRLTRAVGKGIAMEMVLAGRTLKADEALAHGLVNRVVPVEFYLESAMELAREVAQRPPISARLAKESVNKAFDAPLQEALEFERKNFYLLFASKDSHEGMKAFMEKRRPEFKGE
jgi:enoyl-CoA hydratase